MAKRMIIMLVLMAALVGGLGFLKYRQVEAAIAMGASFQMPPTAVTTVIAKRETWPSTLSVIGTAAAIEGVTVSADLPGTVDKIHFESGQSVQEGDILVELDTRQERAQLANVEAQRDLAHVQYGRSEQLVKAGVISKSEFDNAAAQQKATEAQVGDIKAAIARKTIHAPFSGILGLRQISLGPALLASGSNHRALPLLNEKQRRRACAELPLLAVVLLSHSRGDKVAIARAVVAAPGKVCAAVSRVIDAQHKIAREGLLNTKVPLVDLSVSSGLRTQIITIRQAPFRQLAVFRALRLLDASGEWIFKGSGAC